MCQLTYVIANFYQQQSENYAAFFLSDIHLRRSKPEDFVHLEKFVQHLIDKNSKANLYFLGDIFDFWFCKASPVKNETQKLLNLLSHYNRAHAPVVFFEGNHDVHLYNSLTLEHGFEVVPERKIIEINSQRLILEHGDFFNPEDINYLKLRKFLRTWWLKFLALNVVPAFITAAIGDYFSNKSSKTTKVRSEEKSERIKSTFITYGKKQLEAFYADVFIAGHTHERLISEYNNKLIINTGSWFDQRLVLALSNQQEFNFLAI